MNKRLGITKLIILEFCQSQKHWFEIMNKTDLSKTTLANHLKELQKLDLIENNINGWKSKFNNKRAFLIANQINNLQKELNDIFFPAKK